MSATRIGGVFYWRASHPGGGHFLLSRRCAGRTILVLGLLSGILLAAGSLAAQEPGVGDYRRQLKVFVKNSKSDDVQTRRVATYNLCQLHWALVNDPRYASLSRLQGMRVTATSRLAILARELRNESQRDERQVFVAEQDPISASGHDPAEDYSADQLASFRADRLGDGSSLTAEEMLAAGDADLDREMFRALADTYATTGQLIRGPHQLLPYAGGHFAPPWDQAPELMALIQNTIEPQHWQAGGGDASMDYYQPGQALVIRASTQVQDRVCEFLLLLRSGF